MIQRHLVNLIAEWLDGYGSEPVDAKLAADGIRDGRWVPSGYLVCQHHGFYKTTCLECDLAESKESDRGNAESAIEAAAELHFLREGVRGFAQTLRSWAVAAGGHTPSAIIASRLLELIGDEKAPADG